MVGARRALLAALALTLALAAPASAGAAKPVGSTTLVVAPGKARALAERGVDLAGAGAAETRGRQIRFEVAGGAIGDGAARLGHSGSLRFLAGRGKSRRVVALRGLRVQLEAGRTALSARLGGKRRAVFDLDARRGALAIDAERGTARLAGARLVWKGSAARAIGRRLGVRVPRGALGTIAVRAAVIVADTPKSGLISPNEPPLLARPAGAVDVTGATLAWHVRDSWIRYANTQMAPQTLEGAIAGPPIEESSHPCPDRPAGTNPTLVYSYEFPFASGWRDPATGTAALYHRGGVRFAYPAHGIDLTTLRPEIEINGSASRAIFRLRGDASYDNKRAVLLDLALTESPAEGPPGSFSFSAPVRSSLTADGQAVFAGFYTPPNNVFGCFTVTYTTS